jgi:pilus assembly protein Flp/PilA
MSVLLFQLLSQFGRDRKAVTAMEYGLIAALVAVAIITILGTLGGNLVTIFTKISTALAGA